MTHDFKWRHFRGEIILWAVRWHCRCGISCRDLEEMLEERGAVVDHASTCRWVQACAPEIEKRLRRHCRPGGLSRSWRVDETCIKVRGKRAYLYRAVDGRGDAIDFHLSQTRNANAAKRFPGKALRGRKERERPVVINADEAGCLNGSTGSGSGPSSAAMTPIPSATAPRDASRRRTRKSGACGRTAARTGTRSSRSGGTGPARSGRRPSGRLRPGQAQSATTESAVRTIAQWRKACLLPDDPRQRSCRRLRP